MSLKDSVKGCRGPNSKKGTMGSRETSQVAAERCGEKEEVGKKA